MDIAVLSTGGTIACTSSPNGARPTLTGETLLEQLPVLEDLATVTVTGVESVSGFEIDFDSFGHLSAACRRAIEDGVDGVVITHGTDTLEETAYVLDLTIGADLPIVCTGAQRRADERSADGDANLVTAVRAATHDKIQDAGGAYVAFNDQLHAARNATKSHTSALETFSSPDRGPVARWTRTGFKWFHEPSSQTPTLPSPQFSKDVAMIKSGAGVGRELFDAAIESGVDGIVLEGTGLGNTSPELAAAAAEAVDDGIPVVTTSRSYAGYVAPVYGGQGGASELEDAGVIMGGDLPAHKARLKLTVALETTTDHDDLRSLFDEQAHTELYS